MIIGEHQLTAEALRAATTGVADRVTGSRCVAIDTRPDLSTVVAVTGCLFAGIPAVPGSPDSGSAERDHFLSDSHAELCLSTTDPTGINIPAEPVNVTARSATTHPEPGPVPTA